MHGFTEIDNMSVTVKASLLSYNNVDSQKATVMIFDNELSLLSRYSLQLF